MVVCKNSSEQIAMEEIEVKHKHADAQRDGDAVAQRFFCAFRLTCAGILRDKRGHGLRKCRRQQHDERADLFRNAHAGRLQESQRIDNSQNDEERHADQHVLQRNRNAETQNSGCERPVKAQLLLAERKGQFAAHDDEQGQNHADRLCEHRCKRRAGCTHLEYVYQQQIAENVRNARDRNRDQRHFGVAKPAEDAADDVERHNEQRSRRADAHILCRGNKGLLWGLQQTAEWLGQRRKQRR